MKYLRALIAVVAGSLLFFQCVSASVILINDISVNSGETAIADVIIDSVPPQGIQGYSINIQISDSSVAEISAVTYPDEFSSMHDNTLLPFTDGYISGLDFTAEYMKGGATNVRLATITLRGLSGGSTRLVTTIRQLDGLSGENLISGVSITSPVIAVHTVPTISVAVPIRIPGISTVPADPDGDGLYEDLDGDGQIRFTDVMLFFNNFNWIQENEPVSCFDFNVNSKIDFGDIIRLNQDL